MNCRNFEKNIRALLRNQLPESAAGERLLNHAENCRRCAAILEAEKRLSAGFRAAFDEIALEVVPPRIEANLLAVFNSQTARQAAPAVKNISNPIRQRRQTGWAFAAAAAVIVFACLVGIKQANLIFSGQNQEVLQASAIPVTLPDFSFPDIDEPVSNAPVQAYKQTNIRKQKPLPGKASAATSRMNMRRIVKKSVTPDAQAEARFFPLAEADELVSLESGQLVRVEVSASSLIKLGIPFKTDKGNQSVQADLLIGQDGIARAIRPVE
jgi:anti-sigma factor RsiW